MELFGIGFVLVVEMVGMDIFGVIIIVIIIIVVIGRHGNGGGGGG